MLLWNTRKLFLMSQNPGRRHVPQEITVRVPFFLIFWKTEEKSAAVFHLFCRSATSVICFAELSNETFPQVLKLLSAHLVTLKNTQINWGFILGSSSISSTYQNAYFSEAAKIALKPLAYTHSGNTFQDFPSHESLHNWILALCCKQKFDLWADFFLCCPFCPPPVCHLQFDRLYNGTREKTVRELVGGGRMLFSSATADVVRSNHAALHDLDCG